MKYKQMNDNDLVLNHIFNDKRAWKEFWNRYTIVIYNFPIKIFSFDYDDAEDFLYFTIKTLNNGTMIATHEEGIPFSDWFFIVLKKILLQYLHHKKRDMLVSNKNKSNTFYSSIGQFSTLVKKELAEYKLSNQLLTTQKIIEKMDINDIIFIKLNLLHYCAFTNKEFNHLVNITKLNALDLLKKISIIKADLIKDNKKQFYNDDNLTNTYIKTLHSERKRFLMLDKITVMKEAHNFDFNSLHELETLNNLMQKQYKKIRPYLTSQEFQDNIILTSPADIAKLLNLKEDKIRKQLETINNKLTKKIKSEEISWNFLVNLRLYTLEEKMQIFSQQKEDSTPDISSILRILSSHNSNVVTSTNDKNSILKSKYITGLLQMVENAKLELNNPEKLTINKKVITQTKKIIKSFPGFISYLFIKIEDEKIAYSKSNLNKSLDGFSADIVKYLQATNNTSQHHGFFHIKNKIIFSLKTSITKEKINLEIAGINFKKKVFSGIYVLINENDNILPQKNNKKTPSKVTFENIEPGNYKLSILMPSGKSVIEVEKISIVFFKI